MPIFTFTEGRCEVMLTLDLKEGTLRFTHAGRCIGTIAAIKGPVHAAVTVTTSKQTATILPGPIGENEHTNEELVHVLRAKGCHLSPRLEAAMLLVPRDLFVPRERHRDAFRYPLAVSCRRGCLLSPDTNRSRGAGPSIVVSDSSLLPPTTAGTTRWPCACRTAPP